MSKRNLIHPSDNLAGYLFIAPLFGGFLVFILFPVLCSLVLSFTKWNLLSGFGGIRWIGWENFIRVFGDQVFQKSLGNTLLFALGTISLQVSLGLVIAVILTRGIYGSPLLKLMIFTPYISSIVASAIVWSVFLHPTHGPVNQFLTALGVADPPRWFAGPRTALPTVILFSTWQALGYFAVVYIAGLKTIPRAIYEAARIDGAGELQQFFRITIPLVSPTTFFLVVTGILGCFRVFDQISVTTGGGPGNATMVLVMYIYKNAFEFYKMGYASAAAWLLFLLVFLVTFLQWRQQKRWVNYD